MMIISEKLEIAYMLTKREQSRVETCIQWNVTLKKDSVDFFKHRKNVAKLLLDFKNYNTRSSMIFLPKKKKNICSKEKKDDRKEIAVMVFWVTLNVALVLFCLSVCLKVFQEKYGFLK